MDIVKKLEIFLKSSKEQQKEAEDILSSLKKADFLKENDILRKKLQDESAKKNSLEKDISVLRDKITSLQTALFEQIFDEKKNILKVSRSKTEIYFKKSESSDLNELDKLETKISSSYNKLRKKINSDVIEDKDTFLKQIEKLESDFENALEKRREEIRKQYAARLKGISAEYEKLGKEAPDEETLKKRIRRNKLELKIGLGLLNKIGIILIIMAIGVGAKYTYSTWFNNYMKGAVFFLVGICFVVLGEIFAKREKDIFSDGFTGGGIAIFYGSVFYSYFLLEILSLQAALFVSLLIALTSIVLSVRHASQTVGILSLIGGFLPFLSYSVMYDLQGGTLLAAAVYIFILNISLLIISIFRHWRIMNFVSFGLYIPAIIYISTNIESLPLILFYLFINFILYEAVIFSYPIRNSVSLKIPEIVLLALNTLINCLMVFAVLNEFNAEIYNGAAALFFGLFYAGAAKFTEYKISGERRTTLLFYMTAMTFAVLVIPFQFGMKWASAGWITEGAVLTAAGYINKEDKIEKAGWGVLLFAVISFYLYDFNELIDSHLHFFLRFLFFTFIVSVPAWFYSKDLYEENIRDSFRKNAALAVKYFAAFNIWVFLTFSAGRYFDILFEYMNYSFIDDYGLRNSFIYLLIGASQVITAIVFTSTKYLRDKVLNIASIVIYSLAVIICFAVTVDGPILMNNADDSFLRYTSVFLIIVYSIVSVKLVAMIAFKAVTSSRRNYELVPLAAAIFIFIQTTSFISIQLRSFGMNIGAVLVFVYVLIALGSVTYGFIKRFSMIRLFGLGLIVISLVKLFIWDLRYLSLGGKIVSYAGLGILLILVSFVYRKIKNVMEDENELFKD